MAMRSFFVVLVVLLAACTSAQNDAETGQATTPSQSAAATTTTATMTAPSQPASAEPTSSPAPTNEPTSVPEPQATPTSASTVAPLRPAGDPPPTSVEYESTSVWISRVAMSADSIELTWGSFDDATEYRLYRIEYVSVQRPSPDAMTDDRVFHIANDFGRTVDDSVEEGDRYWYGVQAFSGAGVPLAYGWHRADAVTDDEAPASVEILSAEFTDGEILLTWAEPQENYELHAYRTLRSIDGGEFEVLATTWNLEQRSFVDEPPRTADTATYAVQAMDFHWNRSEPIPLQVDVP